MTNGGTTTNTWTASLAVLVATIGSLIALLVCAAPKALAAGDANMPSCPAATESSSGFRASLPDCRAYEVVSQANSGDLSVIKETYGFADHFMYGSALPTTDEETADKEACSGENEKEICSGYDQNFLATRTAQGWQQTPLSVPQGESSGEAGALSRMTTSAGVMFTGDFTDALLTAPFQNPLEAPRLDETTGTMVYEISLDSGAISTLSLPDSGKLTSSMIEFPEAYKEDGRGSGTGWGGFLAGASEDGRRIFFSTTAKLATAPGTPEDTHQTSAEIYERAAGHTYLVGVLPDGEVPVCGAEVGQSDKSTAKSANEYYGYGAIAPDGSNVVFRAPGENAVGAECTERETGVFLRDVVNGTTVKLPGDLYAGRAGTQDGEEERIFTVERVDAGGTLVPGKIFEYHVATGQTVEIAPESEGLLTYSKSGARVYYLGPEKGIYLYEEGAPAPRLVPGTQQGGYDSGIEGGSPILTSGLTNSLGVHQNAPVATADGDHLMFLSANQLTPYKNCVEVEGSEQCHVEAYLYDAGNDDVTCVSCAPTNVAPHGTTTFTPTQGGPENSGDWVPPAPPLIDSRPAEGGREAVMRVVFQTTEGLVPQDTNGTWDVYEWEQEETEGCSRASLKLASLKESPGYSEGDHGCLYLLSPGTGRELVDGGSHLLGASEGLTDIYIETAEALLPGLDNSAHVYDVRQNGGFPAMTSAVAGCEPAQCRPEGEGSTAFGEPPSVSFTGAGNLKPAVTVKPKPKPSLTRKQKLARALKACKRRKSKRVRATCDRKAQRSYGVKPSSGKHHGHRGGSK